MKSENGLTRIASALRRLARIRLVFVLLALSLVPAFALPFAERLRTEWARYREPEVDLDEAINAEVKRAWLEAWIAQATAADPTRDSKFTAPIVLDAPHPFLSEEERRELRNRQLALDVADIRTNCPFPSAGEESNLAQEVER